MNDLAKCKRELIIESPFITHKRLNALYPSFRRLTKRGVHIVINTRDPKEHEYRMLEEAKQAISVLQSLDVVVMFTEKHHRKLALVDRAILYEGSLNILSQSVSCEVMRRIESANLAAEMLEFIKISNFF